MEGVFEIAFARLLIVLFLSLIQNRQLYNKFHQVEFIFTRQRIKSYFRAALALAVFHPCAVT